jgi:MYXO-CTERM domain-containing protein
LSGVIACVLTILDAARMALSSIRRRLLLAAGPIVLLLPRSAGAANDLTILEVKLDPPTHHALGVQMLISGDDDRDATVSVRYRKQGDSEWRNGPPLFRVHPEAITNPAVTIPEQFAGSVFDLSPGTSYEIELHAIDPDGLDDTRVVTAATRALPPAEPANPNPVSVTNVTELKAALAAAKAGDVITLADGTYPGSMLNLSASGTEQNPIVIRGASQAGVILDGQACTGCNVIEVYGSFVQIERMTIQSAERAIRFQGSNTTGNAVRHVTIKDVVHGIGSKPGQSAFTICDNSITGRLVWPWVFEANATSHWDDRGVDVTGDAHVVCHNTIIGFGDPVVNKKNRARSWDIYGNDIRDCWDGTELDTGEGNLRLFHNRWTNVMAPVSLQPVYGGPAYVLRNVLFNIPDEQIKLKSLGGTDEPSGMLAYHNTFVSPKRALNLQTPITTRNFVISNNLFIGPETLVGSRTVDWTAAIDDGVFDYNGYFPDGGFWFGKDASGNLVYSDFAAVKAGGKVEQNGVLLGKPIFEQNFVGPADATVQHSPPDFTLAPGSGAIDVGVALVGINSGNIGAGPDLGALERGCPAPSYGPRPADQAHLTNLIDCNAATQPPGDGGLGGSGGEAGAGVGGGSAGSGANASGGSAAGAGTGGAKASGGDDDGGCGCRMSPRGGSATLLALGGLALLLRRRRRV